jgi:ABC-type transport system involved in Fe-S cluster assembly fused permease/ATPase subunit
MDYARRFQIWGQGMLISLAFVVVIFMFGSSLTFGVILVILAAAFACVWLNTMRINRKYAGDAAARDAGHS